MGIDPSLNSTGYGILKKENNRMIFLNSGIVNCIKCATVQEKLYKIHTALNEQIKEFTPNKVGMEKTFVNSNPQTSLLLGMARGAIMLTMQSNNLNIVEFAPNFVKKAITGNGKAQKEQVEFMVKKLISGIPADKSFKTLDETDALSIAIATCI